MLRFDLKLIPIEEASNEAEAKIIEASNAAAEHSCKHLKKLIGKKRCRKHPSSPNKVRVFAVKGGDPTAQLVFHCCPTFLKMIK
jgi:hypothetical protein